MDIFWGGSLLSLQRPRYLLAHVGPSSWEMGPLSFLFLAKVKFQHEWVCLEFCHPLDSISTAVDTSCEYLHSSHVLTAFPGLQF